MLHGIAGRWLDRSTGVASDWQWQGRLGRAGDPPNCASPFRGTAELATRESQQIFLADQSPSCASAPGKAARTQTRGGKSRVKPWAHGHWPGPDRTGPGESRVGGPRPAGNHQCSASSTTALQQSPAVAAARVRERVAWCVQRAVRGATDRRPRARERALQED